MKNAFIKITAVMLCCIFAVLTFTSCGEDLWTEADKVNQNISNQAGYFECLRRVTVYNARTDMAVFSMEGYSDISTNTHGELVVTCKVGPNQYKKNYIRINDYTIYVVEDITGTATDPYHYKVYFHTNILPDVEVKP